MRIFLFLIAVLLCTGLSGTAKAEGKFFIFGWGPSHWTDQDFEPYLQNSRHPHNPSWDSKGWKPADWAAQRNSDLDVIRGFYRADIVRDQYFDDDTPVLEIGPNFYRLSSYDKARIAKMFDAVYAVTAAGPAGVFALYDWDSKKPVGYYSEHGLQIQ